MKITNKKKIEICYLLYIKNYHNIMTHDYLFTQTLKKEDDISCPVFHPSFPQPIFCPTFHPDLNPPPNNFGNPVIKISQFISDFFRHHNKPVWFN